MKFLTYLYRQSNRSSLLFLFLGILSGLANASILAFIDVVTSQIGTQKTIRYDHIIVFLSILCFFFISQRIFSKYLIRLTEEIIFNVRIKILTTVREIDYLNFQKIGSENIYTCLTQDTERMSNAASAIIYAITSLITIIFCIGYMAYTSWIAFFLTIIVIAIGVLVYWVRQNQIEKDLSTARGLQSKLFYFVKDLLFGFKELKMNASKGSDLHDNYLVKTGEETKKMTVKAIVRLLDNSLTGQGLLFILIGFILFVFPLISEDPHVIITYIFIILYMLGPFEGLMALVPAITQAEIAINRINEIEQYTSSLKSTSSSESGKNHFLDFKTIELKEVRFSYPDEKNPFTIGPINLTITKGEIIFLTGGNGSGKTTLFNLTLGLYHPQEGTIKVTGEELKETDYDQYRELFSPIFSDFYLFDTFYGVKSIVKKRVEDLLKLMQLDHIVAYEDGKFSKTNLSSGQRKRLALIISLLEDKPILALDEWAADQDPVFRKHFYENLLPQFVAEGKTIIAITHDDKYFHIADKLIKMEYGQMCLVPKPIEQDTI